MNEEKEITEVQEEEKVVLEGYVDFTKESTEYHNRLKRKLITSSISFGVIFFTLLFRKYADFNVSLTSLFFVGLLILAFFMSVIVFFILRSTKETLNTEQSKVLLKQFMDVFDVITIIPMFIAVISFANAFVVSPATVIKTSMEPTYQEGDQILSYHLFEQYERYDVVIVNVTEGEYYLKRIIGLPGETITIKNGEIYIGVGADQELLNDPTELPTGAKTHCDIFNPDLEEECTFEVPEGSYFVLGDNREHSIDSRSFDEMAGLDVETYIEEDRLFGRVFFKLGFLN